MATPVALTALPAARKTTEVVSKVLTGDLLVIRGKVYRERLVVTHGPDLTPKGKLAKHTLRTLEPVDIELHVNPLGIGLGLLTVGVAAAGGALAAWWMGIGAGILSDAEKEELRRQIRLEEEAILRDQEELVDVEALMADQRADCFKFAHLVRVSRGEEEYRRVLNECLGKIDDTRQLILDDIAKRKANLNALTRRLAVPFKLESRKRFGENVFRIF